ncbi:MAG: 5-(carboxyamino)imidazole ribonucleotide synthase [Casimicrobiaceae bacterium]|nr:5-(carboxyamino)imidazole ribonucleotide synthase [Casimicrobiaceae bacterium]MDW8312899.1 5-(carboxyamino)imidazole ribonucleotide synthase [Burkholderiales bacterium]
MKASARALPPGSWLGCLGGGQLGRMFVHAAQRLGYHVCVLDPDPAGPAAQAADRTIAAAYDDPVALDRLAECVAAVTTEFENVPAGALERLAACLPTRPGAESVAVAQDRRREKRFFVAQGLPVGPFAIVEQPADLDALDRGLFPAVLKTARLGYDGKGQLRVNEPGELPAAWERVGAVPCVLEAVVPFDRELSVLVARAVDGSTAVWPVFENEHRGGILARTVVPARIDAAVAQRAQSVACALAAALDYVGVLCVELFVVGDQVLINEIAPRPHNSGHCTIEACVTSQFEQQVRVLAGLPLGDTALVRPAVMVNILGDVWFAAQRGGEPDWAEVLALRGAHLHLYGKAEPRRGRKMGHVTCTAATLEAAFATAARVEQVLQINRP